MTTSLANNTDYFDWLCENVYAGFNEPMYEYRKLLWRLYLTPYQTIDPYNINRAYDGKEMRYYYSLEGHRNFYNDHDDSLCSMFEMIIAFSKKINDTYLYINGLDRSAVWFWQMIQSLGLSCYTDDYWDDTIENNDVDRILYDFMVDARDQDNDWPVAPLFRINILIVYQSSLWDQMSQWVTENYDELFNLSVTDYFNNYIRRNKR